MRSPICYFNGQLLPADEIRISPFDRGFTLGDGVFETLRTYNGLIFRLADHLARLQHSAEVIGLSLPAGLDEALNSVVAANNWQEATLRLTVTRGATAPSRGGILPDSELTTTVLVTGRDLSEHRPYPVHFYQHGMRLATVGPPRDERSPLSNCKTLNYLPQILLRQNAAALGADEALQLNNAGNIAGASVGNIFLLIDDVLVTPDLASGPLPGITRQVVLELAAQLGIASAERPISPDELAGASEAFLTNTLLEVAPVAAVDDNLYSPVAGAVTTRLIATLAALK